MEPDVDDQRPKSFGKHAYASKRKLTSFISHVIELFKGNKKYLTNRCSVPYFVFGSFLKYV